MGSKKKEKSSVTVTTPPPSAEEKEAQEFANAVNKINLFESGYEQFREGEITEPGQRAALEAEYNQRYNASIKSGNEDPGLNQLARQLGHGPDAGGISFRKRPATAEETEREARNKEIEEIAFRKLKGEVTPEEQKLIDDTYGAAIETGKSDIRAEFDRAFEALGIGEGRGFQDIQDELTRGQEDISRELGRGTADIDKYFLTDAAERGLSQGATPIYGERADKFHRFGEDISRASTRLGEDVNKTAGRLTEDVARNKRLLGEDVTRSVGNLETSLLGAKSGATLDTMRSGQMFSQALREFQQGLQQQSFLNRQMIGESFQNTAFGLGNLRSRNYTQTGTGGSSGGGSNAAGIMGGAGALMQGAGSMYGSGAFSGLGSLFSFGG